MENKAKTTRAFVLIFNIKIVFIWFFGVIGGSGATPGLLFLQANKIFICLLKSGQAVCKLGFLF